MILIYLLIYLYYYYYYYLYYYYISNNIIIILLFILLLLLRGCTVCVTVGSYMCTKCFFKYLSAIVVFLKVVFKDEIIKFSKYYNTFTIKESGGVKVQIMEFQKDNNNNKLSE